MINKSDRFDSLEARRGTNYQPALVHDQERRHFAERLMMGWVLGSLWQSAIRFNSNLHTIPGNEHDSKRIRTIARGGGGLANPAFYMTASSAEPASPMRKPWVQVQGLPRDVGGRRRSLEHQPVALHFSEWSQRDVKWNRPDDATRHK